MPHIVVVEDEKNIQEQIKKILRKLSFTNDIDINTKYFEKYNKELDIEINNDDYRKIYIMDIELKNSISGIEIAEKIRKNDWDSEIIFVTCHDKMFESVHRQVLDVFDFIEKFHDMDKRLEKDLQTIYNQKFDKKMLKINGRNADLEIYLKNILYITRDKEDRKLIIYTKNIEFKIIGTLNEIEEKLDSRFIKTHRSCLANKEHIMEYNYKDGYFVLDNGDKVNLLSKKYRKNKSE